MANGNFITGQQSRAWDDQVRSFDFYDVYDLAEYHLISESRGEGTPFLFTWEEGDYRAAVPFLLRPISGAFGMEGEKGFDATSVYGYPGLLTNVGTDHPDFDRIRSRFQKAFADSMKELNVVTFFGRQHPLNPTHPLYEGWGNVEKTGKTVAINLSLSEEEQLAHMRKDARKEIRAGFRNGMEIQIDESFERLDRFVEIYRMTMERLGALDYYFFDQDYFDRLVKDQGNYRLKLLFSTFEGEIISAYLFFLTGKVIQCHLSGSTPKEREHRGSGRCVLDFMRRWGTENRFSWLHMGGGTKGGVDDPLFHFKAGMSDFHFDYFTVRQIIQTDEYQRLSDRFLKRTEDRPELRESRYFPFYRTPIH